MISAFARLVLNARAMCARHAQVPKILEAVPEAKVVEMQQALGQVWRR